jgi:molybdenum cofactor cytidylyltransferase
MVADARMIAASFNCHLGISTICCSFNDDGEHGWVSRAETANPGYTAKCHTYSVMSERPSLCGVILAAGESSRMGRDKALLPWPPVTPGTIASAGKTFLFSAVMALKPFTEAVIVVAGKNEDNIAPVVYASGASLVRNPAPERGQFSSLQTGLEEVLARGCEAAMITLVDHPPPNAATLRKLCASFALARSLGRWGVAPENGGKHGHPLLAGRELIDAFLRAPSSSNAKTIRDAQAQQIDYVSVADPFVTISVNTPEQYAALASSQAK